MSIAAFSIRRRVTVLMATIGVMVLGFFSLNRLELKLLPEISYPSLTVQTDMEGAPPEEIENLISRPIEEALGIVSKLQQVTSISRAGLSEVVVEFHWDTPMDKALMDVREKLDTVILPDTADRPRILRYNPETEPVMTAALTGDDQVALYSFADLEMKPRLETLPGVAAVRIMGGDREEILIETDTGRLATLGLSLADIARQLRLENINLPGGMLQEGDSRFLVRTVNEFQTVDSIADIVVRSSAGIDVRLKDIASVRKTVVDRKTVTRLNGRPSVLMDIYKEGDANIIKVADAVRHYLGINARIEDGDLLSGELPEGMALDIISDQSTFIRAALQEVRSAAVIGSLLAIIVIFVFLRHLPNTVIIGFSIPLSIVATFTLMHFRGISLNLMSLGGLALGIGMLVDNSIVVLENIFRLRETGIPADQAARTGTEQVTTAVTASTLTTIAVFFPILFVGGIAGQLFNDLAWTIAFSLLASLVVALSFIPMLASLKYRGSSDPRDAIPLLQYWRRVSPLYQSRPGPGRFLSTLAHVAILTTKNFFRLNRNTLGKPFKRIDHRSAFVSVSLTVLGFPFRLAYNALSLFLTAAASIVVNGSWLVAAVPAGLLRIAWRCINFLIRPFLTLFHAAFNRLQSFYNGMLKTSLHHPYRAPAVALALMLLAAWLIIPRLGMDLIPSMAQGEFFVDIRLPIGTPLDETTETVKRMESILSNVGDIQSISSVIGADIATSASHGVEMEHIATLQVLLKPEYRNRADEYRVIEHLRQVLSRVSGVHKLDFRRPSLFTLRSPLVIEVRGNNLDMLMRSSQNLADTLRRDPTFRDVVTSMESGYPEIQVVFDRTKLARLSMTPNDVADIMRNAIEGDVPTRFGLVGEEIDIRVRAGRSDTMTPDDLRRLVINPLADSPIYLSAVADLSHSIGPSEIRRVGRRRVSLVTAETPLMDLQRATHKIERILEQQPPVHGIHYAVTGQTEEMRESARSLIVALLMAVFLVYLVMASQFESLLQPLIILFSIPLGFIGVLAGLYVLQISLSVVVFIGFIVLSGIVVNNAIVLVDTTNNLVRSGIEPLRAIRDAADQRLRPILMTAMTTVLGLLPMALATGPGEEIRRPLAITVILGLFVSTFLTLVLIPTVCSFLYRKPVPVQATEPGEVI
jgi:hydrophobic/amphiphilic exporter-1 (mainly G- bacteria), HAE1 family